MRHGPDDRHRGQEKLQMDSNLLCHMARYRAGHINLRAEEAARQAFINVVTACSDVARVVYSSVTLVTIDSPGELVKGMHMKRREQHHRHIDRQHDQRKQLLPAGDAVLC